MAYNLSQKIRKNRLPVLTRFKETLTDSNGRKRENYNMYNVFVTPSMLRTMTLMPFND